MPAPLGTLSVQVMLALLPVSTSPPLGAVTAVCGLSRPISHSSVFWSTSLRIADAFEASSMVAHSKYSVASRDLEPPQTPTPGDPSGALLSQRKPQLLGVGLPLIQS